MIIKDSAILTKINVKRNNVVYTKKIIRYNNEFYEDVGGEKFVKINDKKLLDRLCANEMRFTYRGVDKNVIIQVIPDEVYRDNKNVLFCLINDQKLLLRSPTFCSVMFSEFKIEHGNALPVDIVIDSYDNNGNFNEVIEPIVIAIKNNTFIKINSVVALASVLSNSGYKTDAEKEKVFNQVKKDYPDITWRKLFFVAMCCFNSEKRSEAILNIQTGCFNRTKE